MTYFFVSNSLGVATSLTLVVQIALSTLSDLPAAEYFVNKDAKKLTRRKEERLCRSEGIRRRRRSGASLPFDFAFIITKIYFINS